MALRLATAEDAAPDPQWVKDVDALAEVLKLDGEGFFCVACHPDGSMTPYVAGSIQPDTIAGFAAPVLAAIADGA